MFNSNGDINLRISLIQISLVVSDYRMQYIVDGFRGPHTMTFNLQSKFYMCACALIAYIPNHSTRILQDNS